MAKPMTPEEEHAFYADPANQTPRGPGVQRRAPLGDPGPVRFPVELLEKVRDAAAAGGGLCHMCDDGFCGKGRSRSQR